MAIVQYKPVKVSSKGQIVIPADMRKDLKMQTGDELIFIKNDDGKYVLEKLPTISEWDDVISHIPVEQVEFDKNGKVDAKKSPEFYDWMVNG